MSIFGSASVKPVAHIEFPEKLPFNLRFGALLEFSALDVVPLSLKPILTKLPSFTDKIVVEELSFFKVYDMTCYRAYWPGFALQINCDKNNNPLDAILFAHKEDINPASADDWNFWIGDEGMIRDVKINCYDTSFDRIWGSPEKRFVEPIKLNEKWFTSIEKMVTIKHEAMLYSRTVDDTVEFMMLCANHTDAKIEVWTGVPLDVKSFTVF